jgi:formate hydrogenlyase subunit 3/multisubunit Na+/H+ antiporter MnhD subunit
MFPQPSGARRCRIRTGCADAGTFPILAWLDATAEVASDAVGAPLSAVSAYICTCRIRGIWW